MLYDQERFWVRFSGFTEAFRLGVTVGGAPGQALFLWLAIDINEKTVPKSSKKKSRSMRLNKSALTSGGTFPEQK